MMTDEDKLTMQLFLKTWGPMEQMNVAQEECSELIQAISKYRRGKTGAEENLVEEIADVLNMMYQMAIIFGIERVEQVRRLKMARTVNLIIGGSDEGQRPEGAGADREIEGREDL